MVALAMESFDGDAAGVLGPDSSGKEEEDEKSNGCFNGFVCF